MKTYKITYDETVHYITTRVIAKTKDEAMEKFMDMLDAGSVWVTETENSRFDIEEEKEVSNERVLESIPNRRNKNRQRRGN